MLEYLRPDNLEDALLTLTEQPCTLLAGGTDFYPARVGKKITENVLDLSGIRGLQTAGNFIRTGKIEAAYLSLQKQTLVVENNLKKESNE